MTTREALQALTHYPIPTSTLQSIEVKRGLLGADEVTKEQLQARSFKLATADILRWLSNAPNISQGGQSYTLSATERQALRREANALYKAHGEEESIEAVTTYGYKGDRL